MMRTKGLTLQCLATVFLLAVLSSVAAQEGRKEQTIVPMKGGFFVAFTTTPNANATAPSGWSTTSAEAYFEANTIRRVFIDSGGSLYFGYSLVVEPLASSKQFRVSVRPLSMEDEQELRERESFRALRIHPNYNAGVLARSSAPQTIADGDTFALDVLVNPKTGDKITDFVSVSGNESRLKKISTGQQSAPRDFTLEDVMMKMLNHQLFVNNEPVGGGKRSGEIAGPVIWFHLQDRGRFIFSLAPREGYDFKRLGTIESNKMKFTLNGEHYEWISAAPVVENEGPWNLYVLYDPNYVPDSFFLGVKGAAKGESKPSSFRLNELGRTLRLPKKTAANSLEKPNASQQENGEREPSGARLIIGAASRVENLLPAGVGYLAQPGLEGRYAKWLYEDVAYIITPAEALAFKMLKTDAQRETFIAQFWRVRDTDPATEENEFRREYYGRIAYANEHFSYSEAPGWRTDRGRIFITYGKPDEVEPLPSGERWVYKRLPGAGGDTRFEFVDLDKKGEFRLKQTKQ
ncbi:MAG TPA: GWxTD domain-containing protein [Pyrinomonadaceae bacterium]